MKAYQTFYFTWYDFDPKTLNVSFFYSFDKEVDFTETIDFSCSGFIPINDIHPDIIHTLLFHLSLAIGISYYKLSPTKELVVESGILDEDQQQFRHTFYIQWLGEFFFRNNLSPKGLATFVNGIKEQPKKLFTPTSQTIMIALGGGKDSLVSVELIKKLNMPFFTATFGKDYYLHKIVAEAIGIPRLLIQRTLDPKLFEMNKQGYYNGHVPISGIIAFVLVTAAYLYDYKYIVMSNEKSANEGNTIMTCDPGTKNCIEINHQRSKSFSFELDFSRYIKKYLSPDVAYFSLLRWMYELKIAKIFAENKKYFDIFSSCNNNFKIIEANKTTEHRRCGVCPKCAFVYTTLRPFLSDEDTQRIFGQELYNNRELLETYKKLLGIEGVKPFECVGTNEEVIYAMYLHYKKIKDTSQLPPILDFFKTEVLPTLSPDDIVNLEKKLFTLSTEETQIPSLFQSILPT